MCGRHYLCRDVSSLTPIPATRETHISGETNWNYNTHGTVWQQFYTPTKTNERTTCVLWKHEIYNQTITQQTTNVTQCLAESTLMQIVVVVVVVVVVERTD